MPKKISFAFAFILIAIGAFGQTSLPQRYLPYIVDIVRASNDRNCLFRDVKSSIIDGFLNSKARVTKNGGSFTYQMKINSSAACLLVVQYSGENKPLGKEKLLFNISIDGTLLYTEGLNRNRHGLFEVVYPIPQSVTKGKTIVKVSFEAYDQSSAVGEVYTTAIVRDKTEEGNFTEKRNWQGFIDNWTIHGDGTLIYTEPDGPLNPYADHSVLDLYSYYGLELNFGVSGAAQFPVDVTISDQILKVGDNLDKLNTNITRKTRIGLMASGAGHVRMLVPFSLFDSPKSSQAVLRKIKSIALRLYGPKNRNVKLLSVRLLNGNSISATTELYSRPCEGGKTVSYQVKVTNCEPSIQTVNFSIQKYGWEAFPTRVEPAQFTLASGQSRNVTVYVTVPQHIPAGGREKQVLQILPSADPAAVQTLTFTTLRNMPHPFTIHTKDGWDEVRKKAANYEWAKECKEQYIKDAEQWIVPTRPVYAVNSDGDPFLSRTEEEHDLMSTAVAWQLTRDSSYARKVRQFLLMISNYRNGYPLTRKASNQATVQEGHFFQHLAQAYDLIGDAGVLTSDDHAQVENTFRLYIDKFLRYKSTGGANWAISQLTGVFFCALSMQDFKLVDEVLYAPSCLIDKFRTYTMPDGWWYETTVSYNIWVASEFLQIGLALNPFGYSLLTDKFPVDYNLTPEYDKTGENEQADQRNIDHGHSFRILGPVKQSYVDIKMMSDALLPFLDYRGWIFGINDATEREVGGDSYEMAYYAFRDPRYAAFIRMTPKRKDLIYGVADLPDVQPEEVRGAYADNAGALMLRSTQKESREKIQAVLKYATHGGYHGHFDKTGLLSLMRYGRSFYNPEMVWYGYAPFMYNFYVQTSISKNMVTVDLKQQEADISQRSLFHTGNLFQAGCVEGSAAWSYPAYGGLRHSMTGPSTFEEKTAWEGRYFPAPEKHPEFGVLTGFTEPIFQRRMMVVTDDYVVLADYDKSNADKTHRYDLLFQIKGLLGLTAGTKELSGHQAQLSEDPFSAAPLVTDVNKYIVSGTLKASFLTRFDAGADNKGTRIYGEPGKLYMDIYNAWPNTSRTAFTGRVPESHDTERKLRYGIIGDGKVLAEGAFGAWILGEGKVDIDVTGLKKLTLSSAILEANSTKALFWAEPVLETRDGRTIRLVDLPVKRNNVLTNIHGTTKDYENGRINIAGNDYSWGLPAEPEKAGAENPAQYSFDLSGLQAVRFKTVIGGDYPLGNEAERRITFGVRTDAPEARYLTVIEPFEKSNVVESVTAPSADQLTIRLKDGREHHLYFSGMGKESKVELAVRMEEWKNGTLIRQESTR